MLIKQDIIKYLACAGTEYLRAARVDADGGRHPVWCGADHHLLAHTLSGTHWPRLTY